MNRARKLRPAPKSRLIEFPHIYEPAPSEKEIEERLREVTEFAEGLHREAYAELLPEGSAARQGVEELCVKELALRWIVRVAKHSQGHVRERLWLDIERALEDLETLVEDLIRAGAASPHPDSSGRREPATETLWC